MNNDQLTTEQTITNQLSYFNDDRKRLMNECQVVWETNHSNTISLAAAIKLGEKLGIVFTQLNTGKDYSMHELSYIIHPEYIDYSMSFRNESGEYGMFELAEQYPTLFAFREEVKIADDEDYSCERGECECGYCEENIEIMYIRSGDEYVAFQVINNDGITHETFHSNQIREIFTKISMYILFS